LPMPLELGVRAREAAGEGVRNVVIAWYDEERRPELEQQLRSLLVLARFSAVRKISARDHELGLESIDERRQRPLRRGCARLRADVQVRHVQDACKHRRTRLYTRNMTDESTEIFDDLYLGLRA